MLNFRKGNIVIEISKKELMEKIDTLDFNRPIMKLQIGEIEVDFRNLDKRRGIERPAKNFNEGEIDFLFTYDMAKVRGVKCNHFLFHYLCIPNATKETFKEQLFNEFINGHMLEKLASSIDLLLSIDNTVKSLGFKQDNFEKIDSNTRSILIPNSSSYYKKASEINSAIFETEHRKYAVISEYELSQIDKDAKLNDFHCPSCNARKIHLGKEEYSRDYLTDTFDIFEDTSKLFISNSCCDICLEFGKIHPQLLREYYFHSGDNLNENMYILPGKIEDRIDLLKELKKLGKI